MNSNSMNWVSWMTGLQMTHEILLKQLELVIRNHEEEGRQLAESLIGLANDSGQNTSDDWTRRLAQTMEILQNRDTVNQQLEGLQHIIEQLNEVIKRSVQSCQSGEPQAPFEQVIRNIYKGYVTAAQRQVHHQVTGIKDSEDNLRRIELF